MLHTQMQSDQTRLTFIRTTLLSLCFTALLFIGLVVVLYVFRPHIGFVVFIGAELTLDRSKLCLYSSFGCESETRNASSTI